MTNTLHSDNETLVTTAHPFVGLSNGEERFAKVQLAHQINLLIKERNLKQKEAAELLGITQPEVSNLATGRLSGFTFDRLYRCLFALDTDVEITLKQHTPTATQAAGIHVSCFEI
jgi:predicted XRE-type DNA-binding protein